MRTSRHSGYDTLAEWHREKTKSSASEAFKDADYATGLWRCPNEWDRIKEGGVWLILWGVLLGGLYLVGRFA